MWRIEALKAIGSKFLNLDPLTKLEPHDLTLAIRCLQCEYPNPPDLTPRLWDHITTFLLRRSKERFVRECVKFAEYLSVFTARPKLWRMEDVTGQRKLSAPDGLSVVVALMSAGISLDQAWDMSPSWAHYLITAKAERESDKVRFARDDDFTDDDFMDDEFENMSEEEIVEMARSELGSSFDAWHAARKEAMNG